MAALKVVLALGTASLILKASSARDRQGQVAVLGRARDRIVTAFCHVAHYGWHRSFGNAFSGAHVRR